MAENITHLIINITYMLVHILSKTFLLGHVQSPEKTIIILSSPGLLFLLHMYIYASLQEIQTFCLGYLVIT